MTRQTESGDEVIEVPLPALVSVGDSINEPRYTSLKGVMAAKTQAAGDGGAVRISVSTPDRGGPGRGPHRGPGGRALRPPGVSCARVEDESPAAEAIVEFLADRQLV